MRPLDHLRLRRLLDAYADGELDRARRAKVAAHLTACPSCRGNLELTDLVRAHLSLRRVAGHWWQD